MDRNREDEFVDQSELDPTAQEETPETPEEGEEEKKKEKVDPILEEWNAREKGPSDEQIAGWKQQFGECYLMSFSPQEPFVFRPINRLEYKNLLQKAKDDNQFQEMVVQRCVLWPSIDTNHLTGGKAGTIPTLYGVIMEGSNFLDPNEAVMLVRKL